MFASFTHANLINTTLSFMQYMHYALQTISINRLSMTTKWV